MNRHTIVLAEEKGGIQRLVKKAIDTKPQGQERIESVTLVGNETEFMESLNHYPSIILLSTTFSDTAHEALLKEVAERLPRTKVISLTHKYGDRSSLEHGAFDSVDKPIRNPVLWRVLDGAIEAMDSGVPVNPPVPNQQKVLEKPVKKDVFVPVAEKETPIVIAPVIQEPVRKEQPVILEKPNPTEVKPVVETTRPAHATMLVIADDDDDEDDLFGDAVPVRRSSAPVIVEPPVIELIEEEEEEAVEELTPTVKDAEESFGFEAPEPTETPEPATKNDLFSFDLEDEGTRQEELGQNDGMNTDVPAVEFDILPTQEEEHETEEESFSFDVRDDEDQEAETEAEAEMSFEFDVEPLTVEPNDLDAVEPITVLEEEVSTPAPFVYEEEQVEPVETPLPTPVEIELEPPSDTLEPEREINTEASTYNELSEWTLAHEGFKTKKGEFVPLAPPREMMMKHSPSGGKAYRANTAKAVSNDGDGLFGSVRNIFKKK